MARFWLVTVTGCTNSDTLQVQDRLELSGKVEKKVTVTGWGKYPAVSIDLGRLTYKKPCAI